MLGTASASQRDPKTPDEVVVNTTARKPEFDPTLGIGVEVNRAGKPRNRLVTIGDSLTHGFQSGAIYNTRLSWPMIVAWELGCDDEFRFPTYEGHGGLPLNIELLLRTLEEKFKERIDWFELPLAGFELRSLMDRIEDYWERGGGSGVVRTRAILHNLAVYGWDLRDVLSRTFAKLQSSIAEPKDDVFKQLVQNHNERAALRVYGSMATDDTVLDAAAKLGKEGTVAGAPGDSGHGIEVLTVLLGANNALGAVTSLEVKWSGDGYDDLKRKGDYNVWRPSHFVAELDELVKQVRAIKARHVIFGTVPHVTIAPLARGVADKVERGSRYFPFYTRPWIDDRRFNPNDDPRITENEARAIDSAIDQYNDAIVQAVREARLNGLDWYVFDLAGLLDRLASRRYLLDVHARPEWWTPYELPPILARLEPPLDSRFLASGPDGRTQGGLFSLDGVHPTTVAYGIVAQEIINIMRGAGVEFYLGNTSQKRQGPIMVDFERLLRRDSLVANPPKSLSADLALLGWLDETVDIFSRLNPFKKSAPATP